MSEFRKISAYQKENGECGKSPVILFVESRGVEGGGHVVPDAEHEAAEHLQPEPAVSS